MHASSPNPITLCASHAAGPLASLCPDDVSATVVDGTVTLSRGTVLGEVCVTYTLPLTAPTAILHLSVFGVPCPGSPFTIPCNFHARGERVATIVTEWRQGNTGLAVSAISGLVAVSNLHSCRIGLYAALTCEFVRVFGGVGTGPSQFSRPLGLAWTPSGNLLVAEDFNQRVQEVDEAGTHVRFLGVGVIDSGVVCVATDGSVIVVGKGVGRSAPKLSVFDYTSGMCVHSFAGYGMSTPGHLLSCVGLGIAGDVISVADSGRCALSTFSTSGAFLGHVSVPSLTFPSGLAVAPSGEMIVCQPPSMVAREGPAKPAVILLSPSGAMVSEWGMGPGGAALFRPSAIAVAGPRAYLISTESAEVLVFE